MMDGWRRLIPGLGRVETVPGPRLLAASALGAAMAVVGLAYLSTLPPPVASIYSLGAVRAGEASVPRAFLRAIPDSVVTERVTGERKKMFMRMVLPLILRVNDAIRRDRRRLLIVKATLRSGRRLRARDRDWLAGVARRYGVMATDITTLARRVDVIPTSLALAQAAVESGWGTSRFARQGNALFGLWTWKDAAGLVPKERAKGTRHAARRYESLLDSVRGYMHTLNTHSAYRELRHLRAQMRAAGQYPDARRLVVGLRRYAQKADYVDLIGGVIRRDRLWEFDRASLTP